MTNLTAPTDLISFYNSFEVLKKRYPNITKQELNAFIADNVFALLRYDKAGKTSVEGYYYQRSDIENFDFYNRVNPLAGIWLHNPSNPQRGSWIENGRLVEGLICRINTIVKKISQNEIKGRIISGLESATILRRKGYDDINIRVTLNLQTLKAFKNKDPDENGELILNTDIREDYENLFYSEDEVSSYISPLELQFVELKKFRERKSWENSTDLEFKNFIKKKIHQKKLKVYDENCFCPSREEIKHLGQNIDGSPIILSTRITTGFYSEEALILINDEKAMFQLSEIIEVEKGLFGGAKKKELHGPPLKDYICFLFSAEQEKIRNGTLPPTIKKLKMAERISEADKEGEQRLSKVPISTIERKFTYTDRKSKR